MKLQHALMIAVATMGLTACHDDNDDGTTAATPPDTLIQVPSSATVSTTAYKEYAQSLVKSETALPVDVNNVRPPTSEIEAPLSI